MDLSRKISDSVSYSLNHDPETAAQYKEWRERNAHLFRPHTFTQKRRESMYRVNVSSVQDFMVCRFRWWCKWVMDRVPKEDPPALTGGKLLHNVFESYGIEGGTLLHSAQQHVGVAKAQMSGMSEREARSAEKAIKIVEDLMEAFPLWHDKYPFTTPVLEIEQPFELELPQYPGILWIGRPDRAGVSSNRIWHVQNRGLAASTNFGLYIELAQRHYHEHLYAEHLSRKYADIAPYGGTMFNLVRKLKFRTNAGKKNEETKTAAEMFFQHPMSISLTGNSRSARVHKHVMDSLYQHVLEMREVEQRWNDNDLIPAPNEKMNGGPYGNSIDPYFRVLIGEIRLDNNEYFKDREDTYAVTPVEEE